MNAARTVLVTGSARGLGLETALTLAERGFRVWAGVRNPDDIERLQQAAAERRVTVRAVVMDITDDGSVDRAASRIEAESGALYGLVNNAAITLRGYFEDLSDTEVERVFDVNLFGTMRVVRRMLPAMRAARQGRVVIMSSVAGRIGSMGLSAYVSTKFALEGFAESLALELWPFNLHVSLIEPGVVKTDIWGANDRVGERALDPSSPYHALFLRTRELGERVVNRSRLTPSAVAAAVHRALTDKQPRLRYPLGMPARLLMSLRRHLPGETFERLYFGEVCRRVASPPSADGSRLEWREDA